MAETHNLVEEYNVKHSESEEATRIVVVGDWVVDEYWVLVDHSSTTSSHTGRHHYRRAEQPHARVRDLCGAGHVARVLHDHRPSDSKLALVGLGNWDEGDTELIKHLFHLEPTCGVATAPLSTFRVDPSNCTHPPTDIQLLPLSSEHGTTRVIRHYQYSGRETIQLNRIDWEKPPSRHPEAPQETEAEAEAETESEKRRVLKCLNSVKADGQTVVVVSDLAKGAVTAGCIRALAERFNPVRWYVRSKRKEPSWLKEIPDGRLELLLFGREVVEADDPTSTLVIGHEITRQAFQFLSLHEERSRAVVLFAEGRQFLSLFSGPSDEGGDDRKRLLWGCAAAPDDPRSRIGWSTAVFASMVHSCETSAEVCCVEHLRTALGQADKEAQKWWQEKDTSQRVGSDGPISRSWGDGLEWSADGCWARIQRDWTAATSPIQLGIVPGHKGSDEPRLEVWRAATDLPGYISLVQEKRSSIREICADLCDFKKNSGNNPHGLGILLRAEPGAGKTLLARKLAEAFDFRFLTCDLSQLCSREELLDFFDSVSTEQARWGEDILVFVDEINVSLDGSSAYSIFLTPLEEQTYMRRQQRFNLPCCVWIFAGTETYAGGQGVGIAAPKEDDFRSRLTRTVELDYKTLVKKAEQQHERDRLASEARLEQVYLGATMIGRHHPDVKFISREVLWRFYGLDPAYQPAREIRRRAASLRNVQYGIVTYSNLGRAWKEYAEHEERIPNDLKNRKELVRLVF